MGFWQCGKQIKGGDYSNHHYINMMPPHLLQLASSSHHQHLTSEYKKNLILNFETHNVKGFQGLGSRRQTLQSR